jgi:hypothetical protein
VRVGTPKAVRACARLRVAGRARGPVRVSSRAGLRLLATAAAATSHGTRAGLNLVERPAQFLDSQTIEGSSGPTAANHLGADAFKWPFMRSAPEAWRLLEVAGSLSSRVRVAVIDQGFAPSLDFSAASFGATGTPGTIKCSNGVACRWHGTGAAMTAGAVADNGFGAAGSGAPVADLAMVYHDSTAFGTIAALLQALDQHELPYARRAVRAGGSLIRGGRHASPAQLGRAHLRECRQRRRERR